MINNDDIRQQLQLITEQLSQLQMQKQEEMEQQQQQLQKQELAPPLAPAPSPSLVHLQDDIHQVQSTLHQLTEMYSKVCSVLDRQQTADSKVDDRLVRS